MKRQFTNVPKPAASDFHLAPVSGQIFQYTFNGGKPPGEYSWLAALTEPRTSNVRGDIVKTTFTFSP